VVAVSGGGDVAVEDAIFLARICKHVYVIHRRDQFRASKSLSKSLLAMENVTVLWDSVVEKINGEDIVTSIEVKNIKTDEKKTYDISGIFIAVGYLPNSEVYKKTIATDGRGYIIAGENCVTNIPGVFAAGDIRTKDLRQIITAAVDGANAITAVEKYLNDL
jgi:thioredoxin reductase (NADPH)